MNTEPIELVDGLALTAVGNGRPVLWIHGYTLDSSIWFDLWEKLPNHRHVGIDLPGHGKSRPFGRRQTLPELAQDIAKIAARLDARHLVGISFGAMVALQTVIEAPTQFLTLVLGSTPLGGGPEDSSAQSRNVELTRVMAEKGVGLWLTDLWMKSPPNIFKGAERLPELYSRLRGIVERHRWEELSGGQMHSLSLHIQSTHQLRQMRAAVLLVLGEDEIPAFKRCAEIIKRHIPKCRRIYIPSAGHLCLIEEPTASAKALADHWADAGQL